MLVYCIAHSEPSLGLDAKDEAVVLVGVGRTGDSTLKIFRPYSEGCEGAQFRTGEEAPLGLIVGAIVMIPSEPPSPKPAACRTSRQFRTFADTPSEVGNKTVALDVPIGARLPPRGAGTDRAGSGRTMKILTATLLAFEAVILGYDLLQIASFGVTLGMRNEASGR